MLLDAFVKLHDKIQNMKLGVNREREIIELEEASLRRHRTHLLEEDWTPGRSVRARRAGTDPVRADPASR